MVVAQKYDSVLYVLTYERSQLSTCKMPTSARMHNRKMANKKNRKNRKNNSHKHIYQRKKFPRRGGRKGQDKDTQKQHTDNQQHMDADKLSREGSRIMNIDKLQQYTDNLTKHSIHCEGSITLEEVTRAGLASILTGHCSSCEDTIRLETSKKVKGPRGYSRWECNLAAVWGQMATGTGHSQLEETMGMMGIPVMSKASFIQTERDIGECWKEKLHSSMAEAGQQEKRIAEEKGSFHEGVPAITVIVDGGWSKRSHKHTYNAKSGVGRRESCCSLEYEINTAMPVPLTFRRKTMCASEIGVHHHLRWRRTLSWRGFRRLSGCTEFATHSSLVMVIALCIPLSSRMFLDGAIPSENSSAPTMHASAIGAHLRNSFRTTPPTRVVAVSR